MLGPHDHVTVSFPEPLPLAERDGSWVVATEEREVPVSNPGKLYWEPEGYTKADLLGYYYNIAPLALRYLRDRPLTLKRMPDGADGAFFYAKQAPPHTPGWMNTASVTSISDGKTIDYLLAQDTAALVWLANLGCIELHPWHARIDDIGHPDYAFFDLDPMGTGFDAVRDVALLVRTALEHLGLRGYPRTSGATGMQIYIPIERVHSAAAVRRFVQAVCRLVHQAEPHGTTMRWSVQSRPRAVYLDYGMNTEGKNIAGTYSLRPERGAPVATPLSWEEVEGGVEPSDFTIETIWSRLESVGDLGAPIVGGGQDLREAMRAVGLDPDDDEPARHRVRQPGEARGDRQPPAERPRADPAPGGRATGGRGPRRGAAGGTGSGGPPRPEQVRPEQVRPAQARIKPMLAIDGGGRAFDDPDWRFEVKWDGVRAIATVASREGGDLRLESRAGNDLTPGYPEIGVLPQQVRAASAVLDGELVAFGRDGNPSFQRLQRRMHQRQPSAIRRLQRDVPATYVVFDLLAVDGELLIDRPLTDRLAQLDKVLVPGGPIARSDGTPEYGKAMLAAAAERGLEGLVAKRLSSPYRPGARSRDWLKLKVRRPARCIVGGWAPGERSRAGRLGSLLVGAWDGGELRYLGRVGTGFTEAELGRLESLLAERAEERSPFTAGPVPPRRARWVRPELVCRVEFAEVTDEGILRAAAYKGLDPDAAPDECRFADLTAARLP